MVELGLWKIKSTKTNLAESKTVIQTLMYCDILYPNIHVLL